MPTKLLICDDSRMARKQLARCLPKNWEVEIFFAEDGRHALEMIYEHSPYLLFLDLNMPVMDGYETLEEINAQTLDVTVIVVSGDIQPTAQERVLGLGALDFIKKPINQESLIDTLEHSGYYQQPEQVEEIEPIDSIEPDGPPDSHQQTDKEDDVFNNEQVFLDACQEVANVAMGRAGDLLARFLDAFIELPIPKVNHIELNELNMALQFVDQEEAVSSVCQGFIGPGISGEALLIFNDSSINTMINISQFNWSITLNIIFLII